MYEFKKKNTKWKEFFFLAHGLYCLPGGNKSLNRMLVCWYSATQNPGSLPCPGRWTEIRIGFQKGNGMLVGLIKAIKIKLSNLSRIFILGSSSFWLEVKLDLQQP